MKPIYLDHNASTPLEPSVIEKMKQVLDNNFGNPSSSHVYGIENKKLVEEAREHIANMINAEPEEIIFTSGGSESNNMAITGIATQFPNCHLISSQIEHPSVEKVFERLFCQGFDTSYISVDENGMLNIDELEKSITNKTKLISVMLANNETGVLLPIREIVNIAKKHNIFVHTDAAQAAGKINIDVKKLGIDLLTIAAHKMNGPKGIGALYIRNGIKIPPMIVGADHENGLRAGTENVLEIVGLGEAARIFTEKSEQIIKYQQELRDYFVSELKSQIPDIEINGDIENKLPNTANLYFPGNNANTILAKVPEIAASAGAACHANSISPSKVLKAMGCSDDRALGSIRFSLGRTTTKNDIDFAIEKIVATVRNSGEKKLTYGKKLSLEGASLGCSCKLSPENLHDILQNVTKSKILNPLNVGFENSDDASVYFIDENTAILNSIDFFSPIVDDPFDFGRIAAANALSDIYAMGGKPLFANNIVAFPEQELSKEILVEILNGAQSIAEIAGIPILGGHSVKDDEIKFGQSVTGICDKENLWKNSGAKVGDVLILTKPIGTGVLCKAAQNGLLTELEKKELVEIMASLNKNAYDIMKNYTISSCTDVTGFGLLGHLSEMIQSREMSVIINHENIPIFDQLKKMIRIGMVADGLHNNLEFYNKNIDWGKQLNDIYKTILNDPQTSGGLLFTVERETADKITNQNKKLFVVIGEIINKKDKLIYVK